MNFTIKKEINASDFLRLRKDAGWRDMPESLVERAVQKSMFNVSIYDGDKCVGVGRIVGDGVLKGMLTDIMVLQEYQHKGIGKLIVTTLLKSLEESVAEGDCFQLEAHAES